ncbi:MAG TPA: hypothetical protein VH165_23065 [Kofleriaceae bacterium]|jgi:hypothetical protein|nr:hypothetical protein [Kofleriaceae bacterium]
MRKTDRQLTKKLTIHREAIRTLARVDLAAAVGGDSTNPCTGTKQTFIDSTESCTAAK